MHDRIQLLTDAATMSWDHMVATLAGITGIAADAKAAWTLIGFAVTIFLAGIGVATGWQMYLGLPNRVDTMESTIKQMSQDLCVIRGAIEGIDPIRCLRDLP
jgi:hypothetical protein